MSRVVEGPGLEAEQLWYDRSRWASWIDGFASLQSSTTIGRSRARGASGSRRRGGRGLSGARHVLRGGRRAGARRSRTRGCAAMQRVRFETDGVRTRITVELRPRDQGVPRPGAQVVAAAPARGSAGSARSRASPTSSPPSATASVGAMFVFKAAVVGAGARLASSRPRSRPPASRSCAADGVAFDGLGDVDFVDRGHAGAHGAQAPRLRGARRVHARPRDPRDHARPSSRSPRSARSRCARTRSSGLHSAGPRVVEIVEGDDTVGRDRPGRRELRPARSAGRPCAASSAPGSWSTACRPRPRPSAAWRPSSRARCATPTATASGSLATSAMTPPTSATS